MKALPTIFLASALSLSTTLARAAESNEPAPVPAPPDLKELVKQPAFTNSIGMVMVRISPKLWVSKFLVTQMEYRLITGANPSKFQGDSNPVDTVSWNDALSFCQKLNETEKQARFLPPGLAYSFPSQNQWESFASGTPLEQAVTSQRTSRTSTAPVGSAGANKLGLYDVRGNLWQWCRDNQPFYVLRGGAWNTSLEINLRPEFRWYATGADDRREVYGFRCILEPEGAK